MAILAEAPASSSPGVTGRAVIRILACGVHVLRGVAIGTFVFPSLDAAQRQARIKSWAAGLLRILGIRLDVRGTHASGCALVVANHVSWLDIPALQAVDAVRFISKAEVRRWPLIGRLVAITGTLLVERSRRRDALRVVHVAADALRAGDRVALFPEGTTGTGRVVLPVYANLFQAAVAAGAPVQPISIRYADRTSPFSAAAPYVGSMTLLASLWRVARAEGLVVHVEFCAPIDSRLDRRALAALARARVQSVLDAAATSS